MKYAVSVIMLGYTRLAGLVVYDSETKGFEELTPAVAKKLLSEKQIKGVRWEDDSDGGRFIPDEEEFNQKNILVRTAVGKFRPLLNDYVGVPIYSMYTVVRKLLTDYRGTLYEVVSNKAVRVKVTEEQLRELNKITGVAGVWINDNEIKLCDGIPVEDRTEAGKKAAKKKKEQDPEKVEQAELEEEKTEKQEEEPVAETEEQVEMKENEEEPPVEEEKRAEKKSLWKRK